MWSFFQACWHLKDGIKHDPLVDAAAKTRIETAVEVSRMLAIANDMASGTKHLGGLRTESPRFPLPPPW